MGLGAGGGAGIMHHAPALLGSDQPRPMAAGQVPDLRPAEQLQPSAGLRSARHPPCSVAAMPGCFLPALCPPHRLLDVLWDRSRLVLVFEAMGRDLRAHLDADPAARQLPAIKVRLAADGYRWSLSPAGCSLQPLPCKWRSSRGVQARLQSSACARVRCWCRQQSLCLPRLPSPRDAVCDVPAAGWAGPRPRPLRAAS